MFLQLFQREPIGLKNSKLERKNLRACEYVKMKVVSILDGERWHVFTIQGQHCMGITIISKPFWECGIIYGRWLILGENSVILSLHTNLKHRYS